MKHTARYLLLGALLASLPALAQYSWIDGTGRRVFSDQPPPADVPQKNIRSKNGTPVAAVAAVPASAASGQASGQDKTLEEKKKAADATAASKKQEEDQQLAKQRADNCQRAKTALTGLQSGVRIAQMDQQGQRSYMTDEQRAAETERTQKIIDADCQ
jgi:hypothetical protein